MPSLSDLRHLLQRTEFVARPERVAALRASSLADAVDDILAVPSDPGSARLTRSENWQRGVELTEWWLDRMAHDAPKPIQEKMGFFWHGHFCSDLSKVGSADLMQEQIDTFRRGALSNLRDLAIEMSTQVAMLRYLDNNRNQAESPNQNFARELMELFLLGVGNYTEDDVEAATAAWTGHSDDWKTDAYVWRDEWHDGRSKRFLGRWINTDNSSQSARRAHAVETIRVMLGNGTVPSGAAVAPNRGRPSREVAAEFISKKLWIEFAGTEPSSTVIAALRDVAITNDFAITPWLRALLLRPEFYTDAVKRGLVRSPVEFTVALLAATGGRMADRGSIWLMEGMGQRPLFPPNVSGWKHNGYWVNASAMAKRTAAVRHVVWRSMQGYWDDGGVIRLRNGTIARSDVVDVHADDPNWVIGELERLTDVTLTSTSRNALSAFSAASSRWERADLFHLFFLTPELQTA